MPPQTIELTEYQPAHFAAGDIPPALGQALWEHYRQQVEVQEPSFRTGGRWRLTALGWAGHIRLSPDFNLVLKPKIELSNLFGMWEYAYRLNSFRLLEGITQCRSLAEFYENLAHVLARRVLDRARQGLYQAYLPEDDRLPYVRGRLDVRAAIHQPGQVGWLCHYEEHTADIADNQILAWTLWRIAHSGLCRERVLPAVRRAYHALHGPVTLAPPDPPISQARLYHRLNEDYRPLHALCRFFLEQSGPSHTAGDQPMLPFLVDMARLYELFVAEWLKRHLPPGLELKTQERIDLSQANDLHFQIDLSLYERATGVVRYVLDTKYKTGSPAAADIAQVMAYAQVKNCPEAILVYPAPLPQPLDTLIGGIRIRSLTFSLSGSLEQTGQEFLRQMKTSF